MTAREWYVAPDAEDEPTLWRGDTAMRRRCEVSAEEWRVLTRVLAPDEATVERLAEVLAEATAEHAKLVVSFDDDDKPSSRWEIDGEDNIIKGIRAVIAALGTAAPAERDGEVGE